MKFIELTLKCGDKVFVNIRFIENFHRQTDDTTFICFNSGEAFSVKEPYHKVMELINFS